MTNISDKSCTENQNTHLIFSNFLRKSWFIRDKVEKPCRDTQAKGDIITRRIALCVPVIQC